MENSKCNDCCCDPHHKYKMLFHPEKFKNNLDFYNDDYNERVNYYHKHGFIIMKHNSKENKYVYKICDRERIKYFIKDLLKYDNSHVETVFYEIFYKVEESNRINMN